MTIRVIIADDQSIIRAGLTTILNGQPDIDVIGQASDGHEAVALARALRFDNARRLKELTAMLQIASVHAVEGHEGWTTPAAGD